jgi:hypothetical protein
MGLEALLVVTIAVSMDDTVLLTSLFSNVLVADL